MARDGTCHLTYGRETVDGSKHEQGDRARFGAG
jgi:hypothetical protein